MKNILYTLCIVLLMNACKNNTNNSDTASEGAKAVENTTNNSSNLKSVFYETETTLPQGMGSSTSKVYTDDYGKKLSTLTESNITMAGKSMNNTSHTLIVDGYSYSWNSSAINGIKVKIDETNFNPNSMDIAKLSEELKQKISFKEEGKEAINGKECNVFSFNMEGAQAKMWNWKGIPMKMELNMMGNTITSNVKNIQENPSIPAGTFDVPSDITFNEVNQSMTNEQ